MSKFILIDHSLKGLGGHHFEYATQILRAADTAGYDIVLATHRQFRERESLPTAWRVFPLFPHTTYSKYAVHSSSCSRTIRRGARSGNDEKKNEETTVSLPRQKNWQDRLGAWWRDLGRNRRLNRFSRACEKLFSQVELSQGDHIFVPTLSEFDLAGLALYLRRYSQSQLAHWHLQFHFDVFLGRPPEYAQQVERREALRRRFQRSIQQTRTHRLYFYNTTQSLADQYNRLEVARFEALPYPVNPALAEPRDSRPTPRPLLVTCGGAIRAEKGHQWLSELARDLWDDYLKKGKLRLCVQSNKSWFRLALPDDSSSDSTSVLPHEKAPIEPVVYAPHPLPVKDYIKLIRDADIGLMMYDSRRYYARRAGVMCEFLNAGTPVVVPGGCWLAEQIAEPTYQHLDRLAQHAPSAERIDGADIAWQTATSGQCNQTLREGRVTFSDEREPAICVTGVPPSSGELLIGFQWLRPTEPGTYVRLTTEQFDAQGNSIAQWTNILSRRINDGTLWALCHLRSDACRVKLCWQNAYDSALIIIEQVQFRFLPSAGANGQHLPSGAVGLVAADPSQGAEILKEMVEHYPHYQRTAEQFAQSWAPQHDPQRTVAALLAKERIPMDSAVDGLDAA